MPRIHLDVITIARLLALLKISTRRRRRKASRRQAAIDEYRHLMRK